MKFAVLGGGSCFAMNLCTHLTGRGDEVLSISRSPIRSPEFTLGLETKTNFRYEQAHLVTQLPRIMVLLDTFRPDVIINFAALCEVGLSWNHPADYYETNVTSLVRLCEELSIRSWFKKLVQIGSSEVYGSVEVPATEEQAVNPSSPYAVSKAAFDLHLRALARHKSFPAVICMPSNGYCEGQTLNRIIPKAIICALTGKKLTLQGGGAARKSYLHADDISKAILCVSELGRVGETYNCGPEDSTSIKDLVSLVAWRLDKSLYDIAEVGPERLGQDSQYLLNSDKIKELGWIDEVRLLTGVDRMIEWFRKNPSLLTMETDYRHKP